MNTIKPSKTNIFKMIDITAVTVIVIAWTVFFAFDVRTNLDINQAFTFPLMVALELTAIALIYGIWRYNTVKGLGFGNVQEVFGSLYNNESDNQRASNAGSKTD